MFHHPLVHIVDQLSRASVQPESEQELFERLSRDAVRASRRNRWLRVGRA
jgi:hypothetical protein